MKSADGPRSETQSPPASWAPAAAATRGCSAWISPATAARIRSARSIGTSGSKNSTTTISRWGDPVEFTVAEIKDGKAVPYPALAFNKLNTDKPADSLVSVQSVVVDSQDRLWILDTGSINFQSIKPGGAKLLCYDLSTNK